MPSSRRLKVTGLIALLTVLIILYVTNGAQSTHDSPFYTRTVDAMRSRLDTEARENVIAEEKQRLDRVQRLQKEHDVAVGGEAAAAKDKQKPLAEDVKEAAGKAGEAVGSAKEAVAKAGNAAGKAKDAVVSQAEKAKPVASRVGDAAGAAKGAVAAQAENIIPVAGRKTMKGAGDKVVPTKPATADSHDGVAKIGNVAAPASGAADGDKQDDAEARENERVETLLNEILKKGPMIIFSKSYCPYSRKAKHVLLDQYSITPPPYVVELDQEELGAGLQAALLKMTGRRTVPNVLINGKSIGGGDDIEALHRDGKLVETVRRMGGKRVTEVKKVVQEEEKREVRA